MKKYKDLEQEYAALSEKYSRLLSDKSELEYELKELKSTTESIRKQDDEIRTLHENVRRIKHDMKNHLMVIASYLNGGDFDNAKAYTSQILDKLNAAHSYIETGNSLLNHILNEKLNKARENGVSVKAEIENLSFGRMESLDFSALLSNLLDNAIGSKKTYTYNDIGELASQQNARGQNTTYEYYKNGWIKSFTDELGTVSYTYDGNGNVLTVTDENGTITREYDCMNHVTKYTDFRGNTIDYSYDQIGNLVAITYPGGRIVRYTYYKTGQIKTVTDWDGRVTSFEYDGNGRLVKTTRPEGSVEERTYDAVGRLVTIVDKNGENVINQTVYSYDESNNVTSVSMSDDTLIDGLASAEMKYNAANQLIEYNGEEVKYDADGNMIYGPLNGEMTAFEYDCRNRLVSAGGISYEYDAENNRISQTENYMKTSYVVDSNSSALTRILMMTTGDDTTYFVYGTGLLAQESGGEYLTYHFNNIGNTQSVTNEIGEIVESFDYGPYGELLSENKHGIIFLYNGEYGVATDGNGLYYMRARYYNPEIKRFINQDVLIGTITDSPTLNRYAYVNGNPISLTDPFGLSPLLNWLGGITGHDVLDVLGMLPGVGFVFDGINAVWYAAEGDYFNAACSFVSALPGIGDAIGAFSKGGKACKLVTAFHKAGAAGNLILGSYTFGTIADKYLFGDGDFTWEEVKSDLFKVAMTGASMWGSAKDFGTSYCFVAGTLVTTEDGQKPIEEIQVGDRVLSENELTGEVAVKTVTETYVNETDELVHIGVNGETISATPTHPFYVEKLGWTLARSLKAGDVLVLSNGELVTVEWVQHEILESPIKVYNFEVEDFHTYFVGKSSVLVHNDCPEWLREKWEEGNNFNKENRPRYQYNEVEVQGTNKNYRVDSYNPNEAIVSRKYTQLSEVQEKTAIGYINELNYKYPSGAVITDSPFNPAAIRGQPMVGSLYLEVPVQNNPVPQSIIDFANSKGITIIDIKGTVYT